MMTLFIQAFTENAPSRLFTHPAMRHNIIASLLVVLISAAGCATPSEPTASSLIGKWQRVESLQGNASFQTTIAFDDHGRFSSEVRNYGAYPGQAPADLSSYDRFEGTYQVSDDSLASSATKRTWWDRFYGADSPVHVETITTTPQLNSATHFVVRNDSLTLSYLSYPADAPVATVMTFVRTR